VEKPSPIRTSRRATLSGVRRGLSPASRSPPAPELVAGGGRLDQTPDQPAAAKRERWEHVRALIAPNPGLGRGLVVRLLLRKNPYRSRHPNLRGEATLSSGRRMSAQRTCSPCACSKRRSR
jgi:hypothetical protein